MPVTHEPDITVPDVDAPASGDGQSFRRISSRSRLAGDPTEALAAAARVCRSASGEVRLLRVRIYDPPLRNSGRFYLQTADEAPSGWPADMIVMTRRPGLAVCRLPSGSIPGKVMRMASCGTRRSSPPKVARKAIR